MKILGIGVLFDGFISQKLHTQKAHSIFSFPFEAHYHPTSFLLTLLLNQVCSSFEESKPLKFDGRLDVLVVAELSLDRIWGRLFV